MISLSSPENGWLKLQLQLTGLTLDYEISDVGPDSLQQFRVLRDCLRTGGREHSVECFLEPQELILLFKVTGERIEVEVSIDGEVVGVGEDLLVNFAPILSSELNRVERLCDGDNWTSNYNT